MLEFNKNHKKVDLSQIKTKLSKYKESGQMIIGGILLSTVVLFSGFIISKSDKKNNDNDLNRAMISIGEECFVVDIDEYTRYIANTKLTLTDGTNLSVHPSDIKLYNNQSETMQNVENSVSAIQIYNSDYHIDEDGYDRAFVEVGDNLIMVEISDFTNLTKNQTNLTLKDGTELSVNSMDLILFNSKSPVMEQVQEQTLKNDNAKIR